MKLWRKIKARLWDEDMHFTSGPVWIASTKTPPLRRAARWVAKLWSEKPLDLLKFFIALLALIPLRACFG